MRVGYVASKSGNPLVALDLENIIEICFGGPDPATDANSYARDYTLATDQNVYVYRVNIEPVLGYKINKEVVAFATP